MRDLRGKFTQRKERIVWSPDCGGCLMLQVYDFASKTWLDHTSISEGAYPTLDKAARKALKRTQAYHKASQLDERARYLQEEAVKLITRAAELRAGKPKRDERPRGMTAYERAERSFDAY